MMRRFGLRDDQWERIKDLLPGREGSVGVTAADNRLFVDAVLYRYRTGMPWRDLPERFGDGVQVHRRFSRWAKSGVWERVFQHLAADADNEYAMIDSTIVRAHQHSAGAKKKPARRLSMLPPWLERAAFFTGLGPRSQISGHRRSSKNFSADAGRRCTRNTQMAQCGS